MQHANPIKRSRFGFWTLCAGAVLVVALTYAPSVLSPRSSYADASSPPTNTVEDLDSLAVAEKLSTAFENVAAVVSPSVVSIRTSREVNVSQTQMQIPEQFRRFFQDPFGGNGRQPSQPQHRLQRAQGSGFVISEDGYIVTNNHVIDKAEDITVYFSDGRKYHAELAGTDPQTDIAILKVDAGDLPALKLGDSDSLRVGQFVIAIGTPFGLTSTLTTGVVSAKGRSSVGLNDYENFIQTDAAVNPGNSGGPLVNLKGEVVGVNSAIVSRSGGNNGISFAIPINMVKAVQSELIDVGHVTRGFLGVLIQDVTPELAKSFDFTGTAGAVISEVKPDTPAAEAGLKQGDIITAIDDRPVSSATQLRLRVAGIKPGSRVDVDVYRDGRSRTLVVKIGRIEVADSGNTPKAHDSGLSDQIGAKLRTLTPEIAGQMGLSDSATGVLVDSVEPIGAAAKSGLQRGDVIVAVKSTPVESLSQLRKILDKVDLKDGVRLTVRTRSGLRFVYLTTGQ